MAKAARRKTPARKPHHPARDPRPAEADRDSRPSRSSNPRSHAKETDMPEDPTPAAPPPADAPPPAAPPVTAEDLMTEQEKGEPDPVGKAVPSPGPVETIEDQGIGAKTPYPSKEGP